MATFFVWSVLILGKWIYGNLIYPSTITGTSDLVNVKVHVKYIS
jgi:hypothetical protein